MKSPFGRRSLLVNGTLGVLLAAGAGVAYLSLSDDGADAATVPRVTRVARGTVTEVNGTVGGGSTGTSGSSSTDSFGQGSGSEGG